MKIKDNYLSENEFKTIHDIVTYSKFPWALKHGVAYEHNGSLDDYFFGHLVYQFVPMSPHFADIMNILHPRFVNHIITRIKFNLYPRTHEIHKHDWHTDHDTLPVLKGALLMLNTCDGYTGFEDGKAESVENRMVFFDALKPHHSTTTTNASTRVTLNINYI